MYAARANLEPVMFEGGGAAIEPITIPVEVGNAPAIGRAGLQSFLTPPGETLVAPETLSDLNLAEGATPTADNA